MPITSKLYDIAIKWPSESPETIPLRLMIATVVAGAAVVVAVEQVEAVALTCCCCVEAGRVVAGKIVHSCR
jgi:hypothetical protein